MSLFTTIPVTNGIARGMTGINDDNTTMRNTTTYDEHKLDIDELEKKFNTDRHLGLTANIAAQMQAETPKLNLLPTDLEAGHGNIHELVAVLRDGNWIHTRAENLLQGDIISLKEDQCVPADVRIIESHDLWIDQSVLFGKRMPEPKNSMTSSVFDDSGACAPYLEAMNIAFYGTVVVKGHGKAIVIRTGADTMLGQIATRLIQKKQQSTKKSDIKLTEEMKRIDMSCRNDLLPSQVSRISTFVVEHGDVIKRTVVSASFSVNPPVIVHLEDQMLANEATTEELEKEIALQMMTTYQSQESCQLFMKALAPHHMRVPTDVSLGTLLTPPVLTDSSRNQNTISRFCTQFSVLNSPRPQASSHRHRPRCSTLVHGQVSGCDVFVQFDARVGKHVVFLQGPAREVLSRCSQVRHDHHNDGTSTLAKLDTSELTNLQGMIQELEQRGENVISFAEITLDPIEFPMGQTKFDLKKLNFPTNNLCYLGSIGIIEKIQPELVNLAAKAHATNVRLLVASLFRQYPQNEDCPLDAVLSNDQVEQKRLIPVATPKFPIREMANLNTYIIEACVYRSQALSISNTLNEWKKILMEFPLVIFDACSPIQVDLLVETLQELGENVALVASGSANALALANADLGFSIPTMDCFVDLSEIGADIIMGVGSSSSSSPRCDAIQVVQLAKQARSIESIRIIPEPLVIRGGGMNSKSTEAMTNVSQLFKEVISAARLMGLSEKEIQVCVDTGMTAATPSSASSAGLPSSPSKYPASAFRRVNTGNEFSGTPFSPIASSFSGSSLV